MNNIPAKLRLHRILAALCCAMATFAAKAQISGTVTDQASGEALPYANIQVLGSEGGTSADEQGRFSLTGADSAVTLVVSATGYQPLYIRAGDGNTFRLHKVPVQLQEVTVSSSRKGLLQKIGSYKKSDIRHHFAVHKTPWVLARYFPYTDSYSRTPFLKSVMVPTYSDVKEGIFNLRLYRRGKDGQPGAYLYDDNIIGHAKKGKRNTVVDLSALQIPFPEEGFFIGVEFMLTAQNAYSISVAEEGKKAVKTVCYAPRIGALLADTDSGVLTFTKGKWEKKLRNTDPYVPPAFRDKYSILAVELTLSD